MYIFITRHQVLSSSLFLNGLDFVHKPSSLCKIIETAQLIAEGKQKKKERQSHSVICLIFYYLPPAFLTFYLLISKHSEMQLRGQLVHIYYLPQCIEPLVHPMLIVFYPPDVLCLDC